MKIIFLDVDGVLITWRSHYALNPKPDDKRFSSGLMLKHDVIAAAFLEKLCRVYDIKIVVSSTWRTSRPTCFNLLDCCKLRQFLHKDWRTIESGDKRGEQIQTWLDAHPDVGVNDYLILDDDNDMLKTQQENFIQCSMWDGISGQSFKKMIEWGSDEKKITV